MKIILGINDLGRGGAERQLVILASELSNLGHSVLVLTLWETYRSGSNLNMEILNKNGVNSLVLMKYKPKNLFKLYSKLKRVVGEYQPDLVYSMLPISNSLWGIYKLFHPQFKLIFGIRIALEQTEKFRLMTRLSFKVERYLVKKVDLVICNSQLAKTYLLRDGVLNRIEVIPNGVNLDLNTRGADNRCILFTACPNISAKFIFGAVGRVQQQKDYLMLLESASILAKTTRNFVIFIVGRIQVVSYYELLLKEIERLKISDLVFFLPENDMIQNFFSSIDGLVSSSLSEGFSNVIVEAMAHQLPCVITNVGDNELIAGDLGLISPAHDPEGLANNMLKVMQMAKEELQATASAHRKQAELFSIANLVAKSEEILMALVNKKECNNAKYISYR